ncbi:FtsX-like permease family [uncultured Eubacterium sp.]|nr:FtsX-like permease family [uncultured Eubacterium sp.]
MSSKKKQQARSRVDNRVFKELALKNVKKSAKDYLVYFFTITFGVCLFYTFNSISTQFSMLQVDDRLNYLTFTSSMMAAISVVVCIIIGFLIVYANRFLLRRRKKEIGIYITLGMEQRDIATLLKRETVIVGIFSLITGIFAGIFASQGLAMITAKIIGLSLNNFHFMISPLAAIESVIFFAVVFFFVHLFNVKEIKKLKLIDLLNGDRKNEVVKSSFIKDTVLFICSISFITGGYGWVFINLDYSMINAFAGGLLFIAVGTFLFFCSAANAVLAILEKRKRYYYKGLNMFVVRQLFSKVKSNSVSISVITMLLFMSITSMAFGLGAGKSIAVKEAAPYDATIIAYQQQAFSEEKASIAEVTSEIEVKDFAKSYQILTLYMADDISINDFLLSGTPISESAKESLTERTELNIIGVDDYNKAMEQQGQDPISLASDEFAVNYNINYAGDIYEYYQSHHDGTMNIGGRPLKMAQRGAYHQPYATEPLTSNVGTLIVPQSLTQGLTANVEYLNLNFVDNSEETYHRYLSAVSSLPDNVRENNKRDVTVQVAADKLTMSYLGIYLGIGFLITAGAVLALQQLSQWVDNEGRYRLLTKLGTKKRDMKKSVLSQLRTYFGLPLLLAGFHSAVLLTGIFSAIPELTGAMILESVLFAAGLVVIVYGIYFMTTFFESRRITGLSS